MLIILQIINDKAEISILPVVYRFFYGYEEVLGWDVVGNGVSGTEGVAAVFGAGVDNIAYMFSYFIFLHQADLVHIKAAEGGNLRTPSLSKIPDREDYVFI